MAGEEKITSKGQSKRPDAGPKDRMNVRHVGISGRYMSKVGMDMCGQRDLSRHIWAISGAAECASGDMGTECAGVLETKVNGWGRDGLSRQVWQSLTMWNACVGTCGRNGIGILRELVLV